MQYATKDLLARSTFTPNFDKNIFENISCSWGNKSEKLKKHGMFLRWETIRKIKEVEVGKYQ